jgi:hypothetical protein
MFISQHTSADLSLVTPPHFCCNCGATDALEFVNTPMKRTRYFFVVGTELTLNESFPYCRKCRKSAARIRHGWLSKALAVCLVTSVVFLIMAIAAELLPSFMSANIFTSSVISAILLTLGYFYLREWRVTERSFYQPVSLVDVDIHGGQLGPIRLKFHNARYADLMQRANPELVASGMLGID